MLCTRKEDEFNYFRLCRLVIDYGTKALHDLLERELLAKYPICNTGNPSEPVNMCLVLNCPNVKKTLTSLPKSVFISVYRQLLYPSNVPATSVKISDFDITLTVILLRNICSLDKSKKAWNLPLPHDLSVEAEIGRLKQCRNRLAHSSNTFVANADFRQQFDEISQTLMKLSPKISKAELEVIHTSGFNSHEIRKWKEEMWKIQVKTAANEIRITELEETHHTHQKSIEDIKDRTRQLEYNEARRQVQSNTNLLRKQVLVEDVLDLLLQRGVITIHDRYKIVIQSRQEQKMNQLLRILDQSVPEAHAVFLTSLSLHSKYEWVVKELTQTFPSPKTGPLSFIPKPTSTFVGRQDNIAAIMSSVLSGEYPITWISGEPGFGKTQLALAVGNKFKVEHDWLVLFSSLRNVSSITEIVQQLAGALQRGQVDVTDFHETSGQMQIHEFQIISCLIRLSISHEILLVLDNVEDVLVSSIKNQFAYYLQQLAEASPRIKILCTSREILYNTSTKIKNFRLNVFPKHIAVMLLQSLTNFQVSDNDAHLLATLCACVPLAINLIALMIKDGYSANELLARLDLTKPGALAKFTTENVPQHQGLVHCIDLSYNRLSPEMQDLFRFLYIFPSTFTVEAVVGILSLNQHSNEFMKEKLQELKNKSMLSSDQENVYHIHPLLQSYAREKMSDQEMMNVTNSFCLYYLGKIDELNKATNTYISITQMNNMFDVESLNIRKAIDMVLTNPYLMSTYWATLEKFGHKILYPNGRFDENVKIMMSVILIRRRIGLGNQQRTADAHFELGRSLSQRARYDEAMYHLHQALIIKLNVDMKMNPDIALIYRQISSVLSKQGKYTEAAEYIKRGVEIMMEHSDAQLPCPAYFHLQLAKILKGLTRYDEALECLEESLCLRQKKGLDNHPNTAPIYHETGNILILQQKYTLAMEYFNKELQIQLNCGMSNHPNTATTYFEISKLLYHFGQENDAMGYAIKAHDILSNKAQTLVCTP